MHPAPLITRAPVPNRAKFHAQVVTGSAHEYAAMVIPQAIEERPESVHASTRASPPHRKASRAARCRSVCPFERVRYRDESNVALLAVAQPMAVEDTRALLEVTLRLLTAGRSAAAKAALRKEMLIYSEIPAKGSTALILPA